VSSDLVEWSGEAGDPSKGRWRGGYDFI
jgi:hypothetical protein